MKRFSILLAVLMVVVVASPVYAYQSEIPDYVDFDGSNVVKVADVEKFSTFGDMMEGMEITATYKNGDGVLATWKGTTNQYGVAHATDYPSEWPNAEREFQLSYDGDTYYNFNWLFEDLGDGAITKISIDALAGNTVFDVQDYGSNGPLSNEPDTPGSRRGYAFDLLDESLVDTYDISVTYKDLVAVGSNPAVGDLYGTLEIMFGDTTATAFVNNGTGSFKFKADTDIIVPIPEPGTVLLLGVGMLGLLGLARKRK